LAWLGETRVSAVVLALNSGAFSALAASLLGSPDWRLDAGDAAGLLFLPTTGNQAAESQHRLSAICDRLLISLPPDPTRRADSCLALAALYRLADNPEQERQTLERGLWAKPGHPALNHNLGTLLMAEGNLAEALNCFQRALEGNQRLSGSHLNAGVCELRLRRPKAAIASFRRALDLNPGNVGAWINLAVALRGAGEPEASVDALERALALRPDDTRLRAQVQQWRRGQE
jgi:tetratricopeptide (TPR) repeat protein